MVWPKPFRKPPPEAAGAEFDRLMRAHVPAFYRNAWRWTGSVERAEDLVQELLTRLYPMLDRLRTIEQVRPWAMRVMYRIFVDQLRRERSSPVQFGLRTASGSPDDVAAEEQDEYIDESADPTELVDRQLTRERLASAWARLVEEHRVVLSMHDIEGYSLVELAALMDVPVGTLKSRVHRARAKLRELLATERFSAVDRV